MSKKTDLMNVFSFLADFLREETKNTVGQTDDKMVDETPKLAEKPKQILTETPLAKLPLDDIDISPLEKFTNDMTHIKNLMDRVENKAKEQAAINTLLANQKKEFQQEIKKMREENIEKVLREKTEEENLPASATTDNVIVEAVGDGLGLSTRHKAASVMPVNIETDTTEITPPLTGATVSNDFTAGIIL